MARPDALEGLELRTPEMEAEERSHVNFISDSDGSPNDTIAAWSRRYSRLHGRLATFHGVNSPCADLNRFSF